MSKRLTEEAIVEMLSEYGYTLVEPFINTSIKLKTRCPNGHEYAVSVSNFRKGNRCTECTGFRKATYEEVKKYIESNNYIMLTEHCDYKNASEKVKIMCDKGHIYESNFSGFKHGHRCPHCAGNARITFDEIYNMVNDAGYKLLSDETVITRGNKSKITVICPQGHEYDVRIDAFKGGQRCSHCRCVYKGELAISRFLEDNNIAYETQKQFPDCRHKRVMPFDFYLPEYNMCIEYDGHQHFYPISFGGNYTPEQLQEKLEDRQMKDNIKNRYCLDSGIELLRITYIDLESNNIEKILTEKLLNK